MLGIGMSGQDVAIIQQTLKEKGFYTYIDITGYYGPITEAAVKAFQAANGLVISGIVESQTKAKFEVVIETQTKGQGTVVDSIRRSGGSKRSSNSGNIPEDPTDSVAPLISIEEPLSGAVLSGTSVKISANASDEGGVSGVSFVLNGNTILGSEDVDVPYSVIWDSTTVPNGTHLLVAVARDLFGNISTSTPITIITDNFDYYVDSVNGDDSNSGITASSPLKTLAATVSAIGTQDDLRIAFAKGSVWKEEFNLATNSGMEISSYGAGAMPLVDGGDTISSGNFSLSEGKSLTYQANVSFEGQTSVEQRLVWENGVNLVQATSSAAVEATPGSFFFASYTASFTIVYVHSKDGSSPLSNGKVYDYTKRYYAINIGGPNAVVDGIRTRRQRVNDGSIRITGINGLIKNGVAEDGHKHVGFMAEGGVVDNYIFKNAYNGQSGFPNYLVFFRNTGTGLGMTVKNSQFITDPAVVPSSSGYPISTVSSVISHVVSGTLGSAVTSNNTIVMTDGYGFQNFEGLSSTDDTFLNSKSIGNASIAINVSFVRPTFIIDMPLIGTVSPFFSSNALSNGRMSVTYEDMNMNTGIYSGRMGGNNIDTVITNSVITTGAVTGFPLGAIRVIATNATLTVNNTTIDARAWNSPKYYNLASDTVYTGDNNTFMYTSGTQSWQRANSNQATSLANWQIYSGQDANSTVE